MAGLNDVPFIKGLAVPSVCALITFLGYFSQFLFHYSTLSNQVLPRAAKPSSSTPSSSHYG
ncbi:hypothetical protein RAB80_000521 [Fusarium oxysporum f. sp. vasinfectum]|nr:hypothetical protein RAB80_000521 [Fusarium oxysporum f. sp. vasinfectum]